MKIKKGFSNRVIGLALATCMTFTLSGHIAFADTVNYSVDIEKHWAKDAINEFQGKGYVKGYLDNTFRPDNMITRAEFISIINKAFGLTGEKPVNFKDVSKGAWYYNALAVALNNGYINGYTDNTFRGDMPITRAEACVMLTRANNIKLTKTKNDKVLREAAEWAADSIGILYDAKIILGYGDGSLKLEKNISRAEAIVMMERFRKSGSELLKKTERKEDKDIKADANKKKDEGKAAVAPAPAAPIGGGIGGAAPASPAPSIPSPAPAKPEPTVPVKPEKPEPAKPNPAVPVTPAKPEKPEPTVPAKPEPVNPEPTVPVTPANPEPTTPAEPPAPPAKPEEPGNTNPVQPPVSPTPSPSDPTTKPIDNNTGADTPAEPPAPPVKPEEHGNTNPVQPPVNPPATPAEPTPAIPSNPTTDPSKPAVDPEKQRKLDREVVKLKKGKNKNVVKYVTEEGEPRAVIWAMGINAPQMSDFKKTVGKKNTAEEGYVNYTVDISKADRWFDVNKSEFDAPNSEIERTLCYAAVSANQLHWWLDQNGEYIQRYIKYKEKNGHTFEHENPNLNIKTFINSFKGQNDSALYKIFRTYFSDKKTGYHSDLVNDLFINGYRPNPGGGTNASTRFQKDSRGGFFYDIFQERQLTKRMGIGEYASFKRDAIYYMQVGELIGLVHEASSAGASHIVTMWGVEIDHNGDVVAIYVSDSDDQYQPEIAMKKFFINRKRDAYPRMTTKINDPGAGPRIIEFSTLALGTEEWEAYFRSITE